MDKKHTKERISYRNFHPTNRQIFYNCLLVGDRSLMPTVLSYMEWSIGSMFPPHYKITCKYSYETKILTIKMEYANKTMRWFLGTRVLQEQDTPPTYLTTKTPKIRRWFDKRPLLNIKRYSACAKVKYAVRYVFQIDEYHNRYVLLKTQGVGYTLKLVNYGRYDYE